MKEISSLMVYVEFGVKSDFSLEVVPASQPNGFERIGLDAAFVDYAQANDATLVTVTHDSDLLTRFERVIDFKDFIGQAA